jgi:hypothetical protein
MKRRRKEEEGGEGDDEKSSSMLHRAHCTDQGGVGPSRDLSTVAV